jgi:hypothetical protein
LLNVTSQANATGDNGYGLRAAVIDPSGSVNKAATAGINVFADGRLTINTALSGVAQFYLAQVPSNQAGQTVEVDLFDVGDADSSGSVQVLPPKDAADSNGPMASFPTCTAVGPQPISNASNSSSGCKFSGVSWDKDNGQLLKFVIPVPADYTCNDADPLGCWMRVETTYPSGNVYDTTSWQVKMNGGPVRLVENQ